MGSSLNHVLNLKDLVLLSKWLVFEDVIFDEESVSKVRGQWISFDLFLFNHSFVLLSVLHLLSHLVF